MESVCGTWATRARPPGTKSPLTTAIRFQGPAPHTRADCGQVPHPGNQRAALGPDQQAGEIKLNENIRRIIFESEPTSINIKRTGICQQQ